jgi:hypothetical protein
MTLRSRSKHDLVTDGKLFMLDLSRIRRRAVRRVQPGNEVSWT